MSALLNPSSLALVGASARIDSAGDTLIRMAQIDGYDGHLFPINPNYSAIDNLPCYPNLSALPEPPQHAVIGIANTQLESVVDEAIELKIPAITIFASGYLENETHPCLLERIKTKTCKAGIELCGPNSMGFYNPNIGLRVAAFPSPADLPRGGIAWFAQSGSAFSALTHNDRRLGFSLAVSTGAEITTTLSDYMLWSLQHTETKVIGIFLEGIRDTVGFIQALNQAAEQNIPVVILKVGRTVRSSEMAKTHAGAIAGNDAAYQALFRRHDVIQVDTLDEMAATLALFDTPKSTAKGALATMHDSGGERELLVDLAQKNDVPFAEISDTTKVSLQSQLDPGLIAENPLDAWGTSREYVKRYSTCMKALLADQNVALCGFFSQVRDDHSYHEGIVDAVIHATKSSDKPLFIASNTYLTDDQNIVIRARENAIPIIKGTQHALAAVKHLMKFKQRKFQDTLPTNIDVKICDHWRAKLSSRNKVCELEALQLLGDFGIQTPPVLAAKTDAQIITVSSQLTTPLVLKTAEDHAHKTDVDGVVVNIMTNDELLNAYQEMSLRLGPNTIVMPMMPSGIEIGLGAIIDDDFGPVIVVSAGGTLIELLDDKAVALAPFGTETARSLVSELKIYRLLQGMRGAKSYDISMLCEVIARFSAMVFELKEFIREIDVNPVIVTENGVCAVDCLVINCPDGRNHGS